MLGYDENLGGGRGGRRGMKERNKEKKVYDSIDGPFGPWLGALRRN